MTPAAPREIPKHEWQHTVQTVVDGVYRIQLNRPEKYNAFSSIMYAEVKRGVIMAGVMRDVYALVIEGVPGAFATGGDLGEFLSILELPEAEFLAEYTARFDEPVPFRAILECPKPIIAKVDGLCLAGGLLVASTSDVVIATPRSRFGVPEAKVGLADPYCSSILPLSIGLGRARYLMITADMIEAQTAYEWGIVHKVVEEAELENAVQDMLRRLKRTSPESRRAYKQGANRAVPHMSVEAVLRRVLSANGREGLRAFVEKRNPDWSQTSSLI